VPYIRPAFDELVFRASHISLGVPFEFTSRKCIDSVRIVRLGRYELGAAFASGGMATIHYGRQTGAAGFSRIVAIKRMRRQFIDNPDFVAMFLDEARLASRIRHSGVVQTIDVVENDGELFLVMEYVHGDSLAKLLRAANDSGLKVPIDIAVAILVSVLHGLHAVHVATGDAGERLEIVHRDVSPQNVLVGVDGIARVLDFGVAKAAGRVQTTRSGEVKGKLAYMAPEQVMGAATARSDVYAASVVLWEALATRRLFDGENETVVLARVLQGFTEAPSMYAPSVSAELDAIVLCGLSRNPDARFATAREMARALEAAVVLASPSAIGEWVESLLGERLASRRTMFDTIRDPRNDVTQLEAKATLATATVETEFDVSMQLGFPSGETSRPSDRAQAPAGVSQQSEVALTKATVEVVARDDRDRNRSRVVLGATVLGGMVVLAWVSGTLPESTNTESPVAAVPVESAVPEVVPAASVDAIADAPHDEAPVPSTPALVASAKSDWPIPSARPSRQAPVERLQTNCTPPFTIDANGYRHYKRACLEK
jgi:eukaryotic-like serine/threonine-protein kinase